VIRSFADKETEGLLQRFHSRRFSSIERIAFRKLRQIDSVDRIEELSEPPGNRLEKLRGNRAEQWSIRINDQWRVCFEWRDGDAWQVEVVD
jgi:proteic killer suppression protein